MALTKGSDMPAPNRDRISISGTGMSRRAFIRTTSGGVIGFALLGAACGDEGTGATPTTAGAASATTGGPTTTAAPTTTAMAEAQSLDFQIRWLKEVSFGGWYAGIENGYFAEEGIDLNIVAGGPNLDVQQIVAGGGVPVGEGITDRIIRGRAEQDIPFVVIGALYQRVPAVLMSFAEKGISEPADLVGARIATTAEGRPLIEALLAHVDLPATEWTFVPSGFDPSPIVQDEADVFHGFRTGQGATLELQGFDMNYITYDQFDYQMYDAPIFVLENVLEEQEDLLVRFMRATIKGWEWATENPDEIAALTVDKYGHDQLTLEQQTTESNAQVSDIVTDETIENGLFYMREERWQNTIDFLVDSGSLSSGIQASEIMTTAIQEQAMGGQSRLLTGSQHLVTS